MRSNMRSSMKMMACAFAALLVMVFTTLPAQAQEDKWQFEITPYLWAAGFKGDVTVQGNTVSIDKSFNDLLQYVDKAGSILGRVQYGNWVLWGQGDYMALSDDLNTPAGGKLESDMTITTVAFGYQFGGWKVGQTFDVMIGQQRMSLDNTLTLNAVGTFETKRTIDDTVLVVRPRLPLSERWQFNPDLTYGKGDSEKTWTLWPQLEYQITKTWETRIGYRALHYDIQNGNNKFDGELRGFTLGLGAVF